MRSRPGITPVQAQAWLLTEHGVHLNTGATWNAVHRLGMSFKKALRAEATNWSRSSHDRLRCLRKD